MMAKEADAAKKKELADWVMRLYDEQIQCYKNEGYLLGRKDLTCSILLAMGTPRLPWKLWWLLWKKLGTPQNTYL